MRFWGKDRKQDNRKNIWIEHLNIDTGNWFQVFSACLGKMIAIQTACSEQVVKGQDWNVDFSEGVILFGNQKYPLQFIGSEATSSNTWLWGWENVNGYPLRQNYCYQYGTNANKPPRYPFGRCLCFSEICTAKICCRKRNYSSSLNSIIQYASFYI